MLVYECGDNPFLSNEQLRLHTCSRSLRICTAGRESDPGRVWLPVLHKRRRDAAIIHGTGDAAPAQIMSTLVDSLHRSPSVPRSARPARTEEWPRQRVAGWHAHVADSTGEATRQANQDGERAAHDRRRRRAACCARSVLTTSAIACALMPASVSVNMLATSARERPVDKAQDSS